MLLGALEQFLQRVSVETYEWLDVREHLRIGKAAYSPVDELVLCNGWVKDERVLATLKIDRDFTATEHVSTRPVHDGFIAALELVPGAPAVDIPGWLQRERDRNVEAHVRQCYPGGQRDDHIVFRYMDVPTFDQGDAHVGFGLMIEGRARDAKRWLWSRVVFSHK